MWQDVEGQNCAFRVQGKSENGRRGVAFSAKKGLCVGHGNFKHKNVHKCNRVNVGGEEVKTMSPKDLVLVKKIW